MAPMTRLALLAVVFVDLIGQGLVFPIINTLMMGRNAGFLPVSTPIATREFNYGLIIGIFFLCWFLGAAYIVKVSDAIGRKSATDAEQARNMGYIVAGISAGLVGGPIIGGVLSDKEIVGSLASIALPFYVALALVAITIILILVSFEDVRQEREKYRFEPLEIFTLLLRVFRNPVVFRLSLVFFWFMLANVSFYIFFDNYLTARFGIGLFGTSMAMMMLGIAVAISSSLLVEPAQERLNKRAIVAAISAVMASSVLVFSLADTPLVCYLTIGTFYFGFGIAYPTLLGIFSASVGNDEQGWVMGITTAQFTLAAGIISLIGGDLMGIDIRFPFFVTIGAALMALLMMVLTWRTAAIKRITQK